MHLKDAMHAACNVQDEMHADGKREQVTDRQTSGYATLRSLMRQAGTQAYLAPVVDDVVEDL